VTNNYGLYIDTMTKGATLNYGLYSYENSNVLRLTDAGNETLPLTLLNRSATAGTGVGIKFIAGASDTVATASIVSTVADDLTFTVGSNAAYEITDTTHIWKIGGVDKLVLTTDLIYPETSNEITFGTIHKYFKGLHVKIALGDGGWDASYSTGNTEFTYVAWASDIRLKDIQGPLMNASEKIKALETFYFNYNEEGVNLIGRDNRRRVGLSAQSIQAVLPEAVNKLADTDYLQFNDTAIIALLVKAFQEQSIELETIKSKFDL